MNFIETDGADVAADENLSRMSAALGSFWPEAADR